MKKWVSIVFSVYLLMASSPFIVVAKQNVSAREGAKTGAKAAEKAAQTAQHTGQAGGKTAAKEATQAGKAAQTAQRTGQAGGKTAGVSIKGGSKLTVQFGKTSNQVSHVFRHTDALGLDRTVVKSAVESHFRGVASQIVPGKPFIQRVKVGGRNIQYTAFKLKDGTINIGRIHGVK